MGLAYAEVEQWLKDNGKVASGPVREVYLSEPGAVPDPADWETHIVQLFRYAA